MASVICLVTYILQNMKIAIKHFLL